MQLPPFTGIQRINIYDKQSKDDLLQRCFNMTRGHYGWCGTCIQNATKPGEEG